MRGLQTSSAVIAGVGHSLPEREVSSLEIEARLREGGLRVPAGFIQKLSGVAYRRFAGDDCSSSDLAAQAGLQAIQKAGVNPADVDLLIFASATHDFAEPATACAVQEKLGCWNAQTFDVKNACNSFLNALEITASFIVTGRAERVLITTGELLSPVINFEVEDSTDLSRKFAGLTLGDAGGACLVEASADGARGIFAGRFYSDGRQWRLSTVLSGGTYLKRDFSQWYFQCESDQLQSLALKHIPGLINEVLEDMGWELPEVDLIIPHQVSAQMIDRLCAWFHFPIEKCQVTLDRLGNIAAASIPVALSLALEAGRLAPGSKVLLVGAAAGFSAAVIPVIL